MSFKKPFPMTKPKKNQPVAISVPRLSKPKSNPGKNATLAAKKAPLAKKRSVSRETGSEQAVATSKYMAGVPTRDLSCKAPKDLPKGYGKDRVVVMVRDPYWLHAYWEITRQAIQRAEAALIHEWHNSKPILRLLDVTSMETTSSTETIMQDIEIHGGCNSWYINVKEPPKSYRIDIGYLSGTGKFYVLARSNVVTTPRAGISDVIDENWADINQDKADKLFAMSGGFDPNANSLELRQIFEERLRRPLGSSSITSFGSAGMVVGKTRKFDFHIDAELIVYGSTEPNSRMTLQGEPVKLRPDGTFTMRFSLPNSRQIIPAVAISPDGVEERTIILAIERNTKQLEPLVRDEDD